MIGGIKPYMIIEQIQIWSEGFSVYIHDRNFSYGVL